MKKLRGIWPLPGGVESYLETLLELLTFCRDGAPTREQVEQHLRDHYDVTGATSIKGYTRMLLKIGLFEEKGNALVPSEEGRRLLKTRDPKAVYSLLQDRFLGLDNVLGILSRQAGSFRQTHEDLMSELGVAWTSNNQTFFRVCWLRSLGLAEKGEGGVYQATSAGRKLVGITTPPTPPGPPPPTPPNAPNPPSDLDEFCRRLEQAATAGGSGADLEVAVAKAFSRLGLETRLIGGQGEPDVLVDIRRGVSPMRVVADAKSTSKGVVPDAQINWDSILDHKRKHDADLAVIIGASFAGGNLEIRAQAKGVRLITVEQLVQVLQTHEATPLGTEELLPLLEGCGSLSDEDMSEFAQRVDALEPWPTRIAEVFRTIWDRQGEQRAHLDTNALFFILGEEHDGTDLQQAVDFLASPILRAVRIEGGRLQTLCSPKVLDARLVRLRGALSPPSYEFAEDVLGS